MKHRKVDIMKRRTLSPTLAFLLLMSLLLVFLLNRGIVYVLLEKTPEIILPFMGYNSYLPQVFISVTHNIYAWNEFLSAPISSYVFTYRYFLSYLVLLNLFNPSQVGVLVRILSMLLSVIGCYLLTTDYILRFLKERFIRLRTLPSLISALLYTVNPSYFIGDYGLLDAQLAYAMLPWILWSFNKAVLDKNKKYLIICASLMALNIDEHFLWAGFPIILALYSGFLFLVKFIKNRKIHSYPILCFLSIILLFTLLVLHRIVIKLASFSPYSLALTKNGVDVCWKEAALLNMLRAMSHMSIPNMYVPPEHSLFQLLNSLMPTTIIIPIIAFMALLFYRKNWVVLFYSVLFVISILPFYIESPFKWIHYWIFFNTPIGPAFRTWRIPDAYIALSLSVLMAFSLHYVFEELSKTKKRILVNSLVITGIILILCAYSWPLLTGDVNGYLLPVKVPKEYSDIYNYFMNISGNFRIVYIPDFSYSYGLHTNLKPFWSPRLGVLNAFLIFSSPKPTIPTAKPTLWEPYYKFTLSYYYWSLLKTGNINALSHFLGWSNIKYLIIHDDIPVFDRMTKKIIQFLNNSTNFELAFHKGFIYVFENKLGEKKPVDISKQLILISGGYRIIKKLYDSISVMDAGQGFVFIDEGISPKLINEVKIVLTDKPEGQLIKDLIFNTILRKDPNSVIQPYKYIIDFNPKNKWSRASILDPEHQLWHSFVNWRNYAWDFEYRKGIVFTINSKDEFKVPIRIKKVKIIFY